VVEERKQAIALRYHPDEDAAPIILAKGRGTIAEAILELANNAKVPTVEDAELIAMLEAIEVGEAVPPEAYHLVAEVIAFIWRLDQKVGAKKAK
jgi:flagellar biosynthesis protein